MSKLRITGERFHPEIGGKAAAEHFSRYSFSKSFIAEKVVLDVACGEGYGSYFISKYASCVYGVDNSVEAIRHAENKYPKTNLQFLQSTIDKLPFNDNFFDTIVCFETIEHVFNQKEAIGELKRVLKNDGLLIISTPNSEEYNDNNNPLLSKFHEKELTKSEFFRLLNEFFINVSIFNQNFVFGSLIYADVENESLQELKFSDSLDEIWSIPNDEFFIAVASNFKQEGFPSKIIFNSYNLFSKEVDYLMSIRQKKMLNKFRYRLINFIFFPFDFIKKKLNN